MTVDNSSHQTARAARRLLRGATKGALATLDHRDPSQPYASLVLVATEPDGTPIILISNLAVHTRNLARDPRGSLLIDGTADLEDPLAGARLTLTGRWAPTNSRTAVARFLARHPAAKAYAGFPDFQPFALEITGAHFIGGFGRIVDLAPSALATDINGAASLIAAEAELLLRLNEEHTEAIAAYAEATAAGDRGAWKLSGVDPDGADLLHRSNGLRIEFTQRVGTQEEASDALRAILHTGHRAREL